MYVNFSKEAAAKVKIQTQKLPELKFEGSIIIKLF